MYDIYKTGGGGCFFEEKMYFSKFIRNQFTISKHVGLISERTNMGKKDHLGGWGESEGGLVKDQTFTEFFVGTFP